MEVEDSCWIFAFVLLFVSLNVINYLIVSSINGKPFGQQSVFDISIKDTLLATKLYGSFACLVCIFVRFASFRQLLSENPILTTILSFFYSFAFICLCVNVGCLCIIRILCIVKLSFVEETVGEFRIRLISSTFTLVLAITVPTFYAICGDIYTGYSIALLTMQILPPGKK